MFGDRLLPSSKVELVTVLVKEELAFSGETQGSKSLNSDFGAKSLFQASGWIEADPYSHRASTLISGFVDQVYVLEGQEVEEGEVIATLIDDDAVLDLQTANRVLEGARSEFEAQLQSIEITKAESDSLDARIKVALAELAEVDDIAQRMETLSDGAVPEQEVVQAMLKQKTRQAQVASLESNRVQISTELKRQEEMLQVRQASLNAAEIDVARRQLVLDRTQIKAPIRGIIQTLHAAPGQKKIVNSDQLDSTTIAVIFDPNSLQARIDVPLDEAGKLRVGQAVLVKTNFLPSEVLKGRVTRIAGQSDIQRNTLQAKVEIINSHPKLRPEMLCRAEFLSTGESSTANADSSGAELQIYAPRTALDSVSKDRATVFRLDETRGRVERLEVSIDATETGEFYRIVEGLRPGDQLVNYPSADLKDNQRIKL